MHTAMFAKPLSEGRVQCRLCNHYCVIEPGRRGRCAVRVNVLSEDGTTGTLKTLTADRVAAVNVDPIEKKPLYHFQPGSRTFSLGTMGCNMHCAFCQNYTLSQAPQGEAGEAYGEVRGQEVTPEQLVQAALAEGCSSISYTYSEPTIFFELMHATARQAKEAGLKNVMVSNGYVSPEALAVLGEEKLIDAANIDLKAFTEGFYDIQCGARLAPVLATLKAIKELGWWLEVTTLLIPDGPGGQGGPGNSSDEELAAMAGFIRQELSKDTPWHVSRFHPTYKLTDRRPTPTSSLERALAAGRSAGLDYVYVGNLPGHAADNTHCPDCGRETLKRMGFAVTSNSGTTCPGCGQTIAGVGMDG